MQKSKIIIFLILIYISLIKVYAYEPTNTLQNVTSLCVGGNYSTALKILDESPVPKNNTLDEINYYWAWCNCCYGLRNSTLGRCNKPMSYCNLTDFYIKSNVLQKDYCFLSYLHYIMAHHYTSLNFNLSKSFFESSIAEGEKCSVKSHRQEALSSYRFYLIKNGQYDEALKISNRLDEICKNQNCSQAILLNQEYLKDFLINLVENKPIKISEIWEIKNYNDTFYSININLKIISNSSKNFTYPILDWSFHSFDPHSSVSKKESQVPSETFDTEELIKLRIFPNSINGIERRAENYFTEYIFMVPEFGKRFVVSTPKEINLSFLYPILNITPLASRISVLTNGLNLEYKKKVRVYTNDEPFSEYPICKVIESDHYEMDYNINLKGNRENVFGGFYINGPAKEYFPYVNSQDTFGTVFGLIKPQSKTQWFQEVITIDKIEDGNHIEGKISREERRDFLGDNNVKQIESRLFHVNQSIREIEVDVNGLAINKPILPSFNDYTPNYEFNQAYISNSQCDTRLIFFIINDTNKHVTFKVKYPADLSGSLEKINKFTWKLKYMDIYYPGRYPISNGLYKFIFPNSYKIIKTEPQSIINNNEATIDIKKEDLTKIQKIEVIFKDLKQELIQSVTRIIISIIILTFIFSLFIFYIYFYYSRDRLQLAILFVLMPFLLSILSIFVSYITSEIPDILIFSWWVAPLIISIIYFVLGYIFYIKRGNRTNE